MAKKRAGKPNPQQAFNIGVGFHEASIRSGTSVQDPNNPRATVSPATPTIVNAAFAAELYIKALVLSRDPDVEGHNLEWLFINALDDSERDTLAKHYQAHTGADRDRLLSDLSRFGRAFMEWRYVYEASEGLLDAGALLAFSRAAYLAVRELRPAWPVTDYIHSRLSAPSPFSVHYYREAGATAEQALARVFGGNAPHPNSATGNDKNSGRPTGWAIFNHKPTTLNVRTRRRPNPKDGSAG